MASLKAFVLVCLLVGLMVGTGVEAQSGGLGGLFGSLLGLIRIAGTLFCSLNGGVDVNGTATPPAFSNALVQLQCGNGTVVANATTNSAGLFSILLNPLQYLLFFLLNDCRVVVPTPLSTCNSTLPSVGGLVSSLINVGNTTRGIFKIINLTTPRFTFGNTTLV